MAKDRRAEYKAYRERNKAKIAESQAAWRAANPTYGRDWFRANKDLRREYYVRQRRKEGFECPAR